MLFYHIYRWQEVMIKKNLEDSVYDIYRLKTAWYSIIGPVCMGMLLGNASDEDISMMEDFAYNLGIAFQIKDDILGIFSDKVKRKKILQI